MKKASKVLSMILAAAMLFTCLQMPVVFAAEAQKSLEDYPEEVLLMDANLKKSIEAVGLKASTDNTNEKKYSGKWAFKDVSCLRFDAVKDISAYETIEFYLYGDKNHPSSAIFTIWADDKNSDGSDYYNGGEFQIKEGWNKYTFSISEIKSKKSRSPKPLTDIDYIAIWSTGWGLDSKNDMENTVVYVDSVVMKRGDKLLDAPVEKKEETEAGTAKYFEYDFETDDIKNISGINFVAKSNKINLVKDSKTKKSYLKIEQAGTDDDCFIDISVKNTKRYMVIQGDFMATSLGTSAQLIAVKDSTNAQNHFVLMSPNGSMTANGEDIGSLKEGEWTNIAVCADLDNHTYDVYINEKIAKKGIAMGNSELGYIVLYRCFLGAKGAAGTNICVDNLRMYDGKSPADYSKAVDAPSSQTNPGTATGGKIDVNSDAVPAFKMVSSNAVADVKDAVCLKINCATALVRQEQKYIDPDNKSVAPMIVNDRTLVPVRFISESFGADVSWDDAARKVTVKKGSDTIELTIGSNVIKKNGTDITIDVPAAIYYDRTMLPLRAVTENLGKKVFWDDMGLIIISDNEINYTKDKDLEKMMNIMAGFTYERPSREQIKADIMANAPSHPRIYATADDFARIKTYVATDPQIQTWIDRISRNADKYVAAAASGAEAKPVYAADEGGRLKSSYSVTDKALSLGMMYQLTGDSKYVDAMWYTLEDMCDKTKWEHWHPGHFLNAADVMEGVSIAYDWMYDGWSAERRTIIEEALYDCGIEDSITAYYGATDYISPPMGVWHRSGWWAQGNNWNSVCNGGVMVCGAAMATHEKYGNLAIKAMDFALQAEEIGLRCYAPDGGYEEGVGYWAYGTGGAVKLMQTLQSACGSKTAYGLINAPGFDITWGTPLYSESKQGFFNYSDSSATRTDTSLLMWFGDTYNKPAVSGLRYNELLSGEKPSTYRDILWYDPAKMDVSASLALDKAFYETDTLTMRSSWTDQNQIFVGLHGGSNTANHCNIDSGTFILDADNTRWFIDLGSDNYNMPNYWSTGTGGKRWQYYSQRAEGHNTFVINPGLSEDQVIKSVSRVTEMVSKPRGAYGKLDLTPAYATDATKATRGVMMTANRKAVVVQDEITMKKPSEFYWFAHTKADIELAADKKSAVLTLGSKKLYAQIVTDNADLKFDVMDAVSLPTSPVYDTSKENSRAGVRKLVIHGSGVENINLAVMFASLHGEDKPEYSYTYTKLDDWSIPDGEILVPTLENIAVSGNAINGFNKDITSYEVILPYGTTQVPELTATPDAQSVCQVTLPQELPGNATIKVMNKDDASMYSTYYVLLRAAKDVEIEVSDAQEGNPGEQSLDDKLETRWAVEGEAWGIYRFANPKQISSVWIATWKASTRQLIFDIEVSEDGENFKQVWSGKTAATTDTLEEIKIPAGTYKAVKLVLHGTTTGAWNSILEVQFK